MQVTRFENAQAFKERAEAFLAEHEAHNCLPLGLISQFVRHPETLIGRPAPYFAVVETDGAFAAAAIMTPPMNLALAYTDAPEALAPLAADVLAFEPATRGVMGHLPHVRRFAAEWQALTGRAPRLEMSERCYRLEQVRWPAAPPGRARPADRSERDLLAEWLNAFTVEAFGEPDPAGARQRADDYWRLTTRGVYLWDDGGPVSLAGYTGPTPNGIRIGPVYTPPEYRGNGYATALTAQLSQDLLAGGRKCCFLFTDDSNATANHIYQVIGYEPVSAIEVYKFS